MCARRPVVRGLGQILHENSRVHVEKLMETCDMIHDFVGGLKLCLDALRSGNRSIMRSDFFDEGHSYAHRSRGSSGFFLSFLSRSACDIWSHLGAVTFFPCHMDCQT